jgi:anti-anti-sigma regulatory factor
MRIDRVGDVTIVCFNDYEDTAEYWDKCHGSIKALNEKNVVLDIDPVQYVGESFFYTVQWLFYDAWRLGGALVLANASERVLAEFKMGGFDKIYMFYSSVDDAVEDFHAYLDRISITRTRLDR